MAEVDGRLHGRLRYGPGALDEAAADRFVNHFAALLDRVAEDPDAPIGDFTGTREQRADDLAASGPRFLRRPGDTARA